MSKLNFDDLPDPGDRFILGECLGVGICAKVHFATDSESGNRKVAIKIQNLNRDNIPYIKEEYRVLRELSNHTNLPEFYGIFRKNTENEDEIWFVIELCEGGSVIDLVNGMIKNNRRMNEEHIAFIIKEVVKALIHLHENHVIHRDVKGSNIMLTKEGEVKLIDFGLSRHLSSTFGKSSSCLGSPCWMAPEVVTSSLNEDDDGYGNRADVWALGITTIELGDGKAPLQDIHPSRAIFQIVRNPPPTLYRPSNWSEQINDFINECLVKNAEHRPFIMELLEHPFLDQIPENNYHLNQELKTLCENMKGSKIEKKSQEVLINNQFLKNKKDELLERMHVEDLAALDRLSEEAIIQELEARFKENYFHTFIGDILLVLNPNQHLNIYNDKYHSKYQCKSRSDNAPHIYAVADSAYQNALHHELQQYILLSGESCSGKTTNFLHLIDHFLYLSCNPIVNFSRIKDSIKLIHAFTHASTPINDYSTRCIMKTELTFSSTGKVTGAIFGIFQLDKWRVSSMDMSQSNYNIFYYFYDGLQAVGDLNKYKLQEGRQYRYLRIPEQDVSNGPRCNREKNIEEFKSLETIMESLDFSQEQKQSVFNILAAILNLGDVRFKQSEQGMAEIENKENVSKVASLLQVDEKKLMWALTNYCLLKQGIAVRRRHSCDEARDARDVFANTLYSRIVDYLISVINNLLSHGRAIFGEKYSIKLVDMFGFECFKKNHITQLFINTLNEQFHYHYLQRIFAWEALEMTQEDVPFSPLHYYDNKTTLDQILSKPEGVITLIDDASRMGHGGQYILDYLRGKDHISIVGQSEFAIAHYTGKVTYDAKEMPDRNRDFLPPEVIEVIRLSKNPIIKPLFANKLTRMGNLYMSFDESAKTKKRPKLSSSSSDDDAKKNEFSQIKKMRTASSIFRSLCLELLKELSIGGSAGGTHFVKCIRTDLEGIPKKFHTEIVKQQLRASSIVETAKARQLGYPHRIPFNEFLRRYKFLAFDFDENVEISKENCRLLLVRLKMEGWLIGKSKVFLKYYNEEYLSRLYEIQVKKIVKIQSMMRSFLIKRRMLKKQNQKTFKLVAKDTNNELTEEEAAVILQKARKSITKRTIPKLSSGDFTLLSNIFIVAYRGVASRKAYVPLVAQNYNQLDEETCKFIKFFAKKWQAKSIFQVLLQYRAHRYQDMFNLSQQVHLYNQNSVHSLQKTNNNIGLEVINGKAQANVWLGETKPTVLKLPFRFDDIPYFDTSYMCDPLTNPGTSLEMEESWDSPFQWRETVSSQITASLLMKNEPTIAPNTIVRGTQQTYETLIHLPYSRNPFEPIRRLSSLITEPEEENIRNHHVNQKLETKHDTNKRNMQEKMLCDENNCNSYSASSPNQINSCSKPANKDFHYIKPVNHDATKRIPETANPIAELQNIGRKSSKNDDDAPFNFQGMLRKTNLRRDSLKTNLEVVRRFSLKKQEITNVSERKEHLDNVKKRCNSVDFNSTTISTEVAPGVYLEGLVFHL